MWCRAAGPLVHPAWLRTTLGQRLAVAREARAQPVREQGPTSASLQSGITTQSQAWNPLCPEWGASHRQPLTTKGSCSPSEASAAAALVVTRPNSPIPKVFLADSLQALSQLPACGRVRREAGAGGMHQDPGMLCCPDSAALKGLDCLRAHVDPR